jgi:hypothetical protein
LFVDTPPTMPGGMPTTKQIGRRRVFAANAISQQAVANWGFSVVDVQTVPGTYTYRVTAQLVSGALTASGVIVSGGSATAIPPSPVPHLRGTLTAVGINK